MSDATTKFSQQQQQRAEADHARTAPPSVPVASDPEPQLTIDGPGASTKKKVRGEAKKKVRGEAGRPTFKRVRFEIDRIPLRERELVQIRAGYARTLVRKACFKDKNCAPNQMKSIEITMEELFALDEIRGESPAYIQAREDKLAFKYMFRAKASVNLAAQLKKERATGLQRGYPLTLSAEDRLSAIP